MYIFERKFKLLKNCSHVFMYVLKDFIQIFDKTNKNTHPHLPPQMHYVSDLKLSAWISPWNKTPQCWLSAQLLFSNTKSKYPNLNTYKTKTLQSESDVKMPFGNKYFICTLKAAKSINVFFWCGAIVRGHNSTV